MAIHQLLFGDKTECAKWLPKCRVVAKRLLAQRSNNVQLVSSGDVSARVWTTAGGQAWIYIDAGRVQLLSLGFENGAYWVRGARNTLSYMRARAAQFPSDLATWPTGIIPCGDRTGLLARWDLDVTEVFIEGVTLYKTERAGRVASAVGTSFTVDQTPDSSPLLTQLKPFYCGEGANGKRYAVMANDTVSSRYRGYVGIVDAAGSSTKRTTAPTYDQYAQRAWYLGEDRILWLTVEHDTGAKSTLMSTGNAQVVLYYSTDLGATWTKLTFSNLDTHFDPKTIEWTLSSTAGAWGAYVGDGELLIGFLTGGGGAAEQTFLFKCSDSSLTSKGIVTKEVKLEEPCVPAPGACILLCLDGATYKYYRTEDSGATWSYLSDCPTSTTNYLGVLTLLEAPSDQNADNAKVMIPVYENNARRIYVSADGGASFVPAGVVAEGLSAPASALQSWSTLTAMGTARAPLAADPVFPERYNAVA